MISVIFDLDGTLVDSEPNYYESGRRTLERHGVPDFTWEQHSRFIGIGTRETLEILRDRYGIRAPVEQLLAEQNAAYLELARTRTEVFPQMRGFVERLHGEGVAMAVASGSSLEAIDAVLSGTGLDALLTTTVSAEEVARGKPAPDVFPGGGPSAGRRARRLCGRRGRGARGAGRARRGHGLRGGPVHPGHRGGPGLRLRRTPLPGRAAAVQRGRGVRLAVRTPDRVAGRGGHQGGHRVAEETLSALWRPAGATVTMPA
ncbi:HAD family hydrolase [Streptomyces virginiae]